jgi:hypothetical protein
MEILMYFSPLLSSAETRGSGEGEVEAVGVVAVVGDDGIVDILNVCAGVKKDQGAVFEDTNPLILVLLHEVIMFVCIA